MTFEEMDINSIIEEVLSYDCNRVIFTGGEPAMQDLSIIGKRLKEHGIKVVHVVSSAMFAAKSEAVGVDAVVCEGFEAGPGCTNDQ